MSTKMLRMGQFELTQPIMRVSDPCYTADVWCSYTLKNCLPGKWEAAMLIKNDDEWGQRVSKLMVRHKDAPSFQRAFGKVRLVEYKDECRIVYPTFLKSECTIGVDSGQAGFFDETHFRDNSVLEEAEQKDCEYGDPWYTKCCHCSSGQDLGGMIPFGVVSSSGYGDGGYDVLCLEKDGNIIAAMMLFC